MASGRPSHRLRVGRPIRLVLGHTLEPCGGYSSFRWFVSAGGVRRWSSNASFPAVIHQISVACGRGRRGHSKGTQLNLRGSVQDGTASFLKQGRPALPVERLWQAATFCTAKLDGAAAHNLCLQSRRSMELAKETPGTWKFLDHRHRRGYHICLSSVSEAESIRIVRKPWTKASIPGTTAGLQRRRQRRAYGKGAADGLSAESLSDDKIDGRTGASARPPVGRVLVRLRQIHIDLLQSMSHREGDPEQASIRIRMDVLKQARRKARFALSDYRDKV